MFERAVETDVLPVVRELGIGFGRRRDAARAVGVIAPGLAGHVTLVGHVADSGRLTSARAENTVPETGTQSRQSNQVITFPLFHEVERW
ncbi:hypothetical protein [Streptomyces sp. NPDC014744]|uniref:hypothetical protein n=1 Tax=Streptomyces sp. NPDC014744 TaxID=3364903 RepID=UPI0036F618A7